MVHYIFQIAVFQLFFLLTYDVFFKKETFFNWNRAYLLITPMLSFILPSIKIDGFKDVVPQQFVIKLPEVVLGNEQANNINVISESIENNQPLSTLPILEIIYYLGIVIALSIFIVKVFKILAIILKNPKQKSEKTILISVINSSSAFSFFNYIFLGDYIKEDEKTTILKHELTHVKQKHTLDLLFFEVLRIVFWFNPLVYMYQNRTMVLHEFIADAHAVKHQEKSHYYQNLLSQVFNTKSISFINLFFKQSLIKKRIVMLQKSKSKQIHLVKYALLIPIVFGMLIYTSSAQNAYSSKKEVLLDYVQDKISQNASEEIQNTPLIEKIKAVKNQIEIQGNVSPEEEKGLDLLLKIIKSTELDTDLVKEIQAYTDIENKTVLVEKISDVFLQIQEQGNITTEEEKALKGLFILISNDGLNDPFFADVLEDVEVPFGVVEDVPVYPGCESLTSNEERKACMSENISKLVAKKFNTKLADSLGLKGRQRINVLFKIDKEGNVKDVRSRATHPALEAEAIRVINLLPKMMPAKQKGKKVTVPYSLPIVFQVADEDKETKAIQTTANITPINEVVKLNEIDFPFAVVDEAPIFPGCEYSTSEEAMKKCFSDNITQFVNKNFNTKLAKDIGLQGRQRINVIFKISKEGYVVNIKSRATNPVIEAEALRVISAMPKMIPGKQKGENVNVLYSLPIIFQVSE
jgi:bla regulator protein blaR1